MPEVQKKKRPAIGWPLGLSYLTVLLLVALSVIAVLMTTICSRGYMKKQIQRSAYTDTVYAQLVDNYTSYGAATGFSEEVMTSFISREQITADMNTTIDEIFEGDTAYNVRNEISNACYEALKADVESRGLEVTDDVKSGIAVLADACRQDYASYVGIPLASQYYTIVDKLNHILWVGLILCVVFAGVSLLLTVRLAGSARTGLRCLVFTFTSAAALCALLAFAIYPALKLGGMSIQPASLRLFLLAYIQHLFGSFGVFVIVYGVLAIALFALTFMARSMASRRAQGAAKLS